MTITDLLGFDPARLIQQITQLIYAPTTNVLASSLLLATAVLLVVIVMIGLILLVLRRPKSRAHRTTIVLDASGEPVSVSVDSIKPKADKSARLRGLVFLGALLILFWLAAGYSTMQSAVCAECHSDTPHEMLVDPAPHAGTDCVRCHEPGGWTYSMTVALPSRVVHLVQGFNPPEKLAEYGRSDSSSCLSCHDAGIRVTTENVRRGIRVSHKEPLEAGARCSDCHRPNEAGVIAGSYGGMNPCLRCHDGDRAANDCTLCHTKDIAAAQVADRFPLEKGAKILVTDPKMRCYDCHDPAPCDSCHGMRIPHPESFEGWGHAYEGVKSLWAGDSGQCRECHTEERRPCVQSGCHSTEFPYHLQRDPQFSQHHAWGRWIDASQNPSSPSNLGCATCHRGDICTGACHSYRPERPIPPQVINPGWTDPALEAEE